MDFGEVLGTAWKIIWKHKILWIFGIFAGCSRGGGGGGGGGGGNRVTTPGGTPPQFQEFGTQFFNWIQGHMWVVALFILVILLIVILSLLLGTMGRIALIKGTAKADAGAEHLGFGELWDESRPYFWRIFLLSLLIGVALLIVLVPIIALGIGFTALTLGLGALCLIPLVCLLVPAVWLLGIVVQQAETAIVTENLGIQDGLRRGWDVFRKNIGPMLLMWLILLVIGIIVSLAIAIPVLIIVIPAAIAFAAANSGSSGVVNTPTLPLLLAGLCFVAYLPFLLVLNGVLTGYIQSAWTLTYLRVTKPKDNSVIESPAVPAPNA